MGVPRWMRSRTFVAAGGVAVLIAAGTTIAVASSSLPNDAGHAMTKLGLDDRVGGQDEVGDNQQGDGDDHGRGDPNEPSGQRDDDLAPPASGQGVDPSQSCGQEDHGSRAEAEKKSERAEEKAEQVQKGREGAEEKSEKTEKRSGRDEAGEPRDREHDSDHTGNGDDCD